MRKAFFILISLAVTLAPIAQAQAPAPKARTTGKLSSHESEKNAKREEIKLSTGEDRAVDLGFDIADEQKQLLYSKEIVYVQVARIDDKTQLVFKPLKKGTSSVMVRDTEGKIRIVYLVRVSENNLMREAAEIRKILKEVEGLEVSVVGKKVVIEGEILTPDDFGMVQRVLAQGDYVNDVIDKTRMSPIALTVLAKKIQEEINVFAPNVRTRVVNGVVFLEGTVENQDSASRALRVAELYLPEVKPASTLVADERKVQTNVRRATIYNAIIIQPAPPKKLAKLVRVRFDFVELGKDYLKAFGLQWTPSIGSPQGATSDQIAIGAAGAAAPTFSAVISNLFPKLNFLTQAGYARVIKTGNLVIKSGEAGTLKDQVTYSSPVLAANGAPSFQQQNVGTDVAVTPMILGTSEDISMNINFQQSAPVGAVKAGQPPVVAAHSVHTNLYVRSGESAAIAGVETSTATTSFNGDGGGGEGISPLISLIHSKNYKKNRSQFVIFFTPQIVENAVEGTEDLRRNYRIKVK